MMETRCLENDSGQNNITSSFVSTNDTIITSEYDDLAREESMLHQPMLIHHHDDQQTLNTLSDLQNPITSPNDGTQDANNSNHKRINKRALGYTILHTSLWLASVIFCILVSAAHVWNGVLCSWKLVDYCMMIMMGTWTMCATCFYTNTQYHRHVLQTIDRQAMNASNRDEPNTDSMSVQELVRAEWFRYHVVTLIWTICLITSTVFSWIPIFLYGIEKNACNKHVMYWIQVLVLIVCAFVIVAGLQFVYTFLIENYREYIQPMIHSCLQSIPVYCISIEYVGSSTPSLQQPTQPTTVSSAHVQQQQHQQQQQDNDVESVYTLDKPIELVEICNTCGTCSNQTKESF